MMSCQKEKRIDVLNLRSPEKVTLVFGKHEYDFSFLRNIMHPRLWPHKTVPFLYSACFRNKVRVFCMNLALELKEMPRNMYNFRFLDVLTFPYMCIYKKGNITEAYVSVKDRRENEFFFFKMDNEICFTFGFLSGNHRTTVCWTQSLIFNHLIFRIILLSKTPQF